MFLFLAGITIFCAVHLFKAAAPSARDRLVARLGENPYKGLFSLLILGALVLIVFGWKAVTPRAVYLPPLAPGLVPAALMLIALILFLASQTNGYLKRGLRHPQMLGTIVWAVTHLLVNGDSRALILFGSLAVWALLEIVLCNRRDGPRAALPRASAKADVIAVFLGVVAFGLIGHFHLALFGVAAFPV